MKFNHLATSALIGACALAAQPAAAITTGTYALSNHPDGSASPPAYGLRLDGLFTGSGSEIYTFDFDHASSSMTLTWDGSKIVIDGQAFGGEDAGAGGYVGGTTAIWNIHFEYTVGISQPGGEGGLDDLYVNADNANFGTISSSLGSFELEDQDKNGLAFQFGDENGAGHRNFNGISGWGWVNHGTDCIANNCGHIAASDWLFTATLVPVPAAVWLFGSGLLGLIGVARRRS